MIKYILIKIYLIKQKFKQILLIYNMEDLTKTITYYYVKDSIFETDKERNNFIKYCEYMMFSNYDEPHPISDEDYKDYFRGLYKAVEMRYEQDAIEEYYAEKEYEEMKYYEDEDHHNYYYNVNCDEDLYLMYKFI